MQPSPVASLITFTPLIQSPEHNLIRIERTHDLPTNIHLVASGPFQGIIVNKLADQFEAYPTQFPGSFSVWISHDEGKTLKQEIRSFRFCFFNHVPMSERAATSQRFIKSLFERSFPKDYVSFFKLVLRLVKTNYPQLRAIDIEMKFATGGEKMAMPSAKQFQNDGELEALTSGHVKEALEHAYPNTVSDQELADSLRCSLEEVRMFLAILEREGQVECLNGQTGEWIRKAHIPEPKHQVQEKHPQTVAIITCLFPEKQSVDTIIENSSTSHSYSKTGDSNVYTLGKIAGHNVVATKLSMIGGDRMAATSAGSITTRLLGTFQHVDHVIIVGIGGGVPHYTDPEMHTRLGDVVISHPGVDESVNRQIGSYVYAHNVTCHWKTGTIEGLAVRDWMPKDNTLARAVRNGNKTGLLEEWKANATDLIGRLNDQYRDQQLDFSRPADSSDVLTMLTSEGNVVVFPHPNAERNSPIFHLGPVGSMFTLREKPVKPPSLSPPIPSTPLRPTKRSNKEIPPLPGAAGDSAASNLDGQNGGTAAAAGMLTSADLPMEPIHETRSASTISNVDTISRAGRNAGMDDTMDDGEVVDGSDGGGGGMPVAATANDTNNNNGGGMEVANTQLNQQLREKFISDYHLRAYDAGFDSVIAAIVGSRVDSWVLVRGVADYQQGTTKLGKLWQHYASANAAAMVKTILSHIPPPKH